MQFLRNFSRIIIGLVFIFSGFVKGVDPWGTAFKFHDYFIALNIDWLMPYALFLAFVMIFAEFIIGWLLLFNTATRFASWMVLLFMLVFTPLTLWLALENKVTDCGCFGDFLVMTNWETFIKNVVIDVFVLIIFFTRKKFTNKMTVPSKLVWFIIGSGIILGTMIYSYNHLPVFDFRPWKKGTNIAEKVVGKPEVSEVIFKYRNKETGAIEDYTIKSLPRTGLDTAVYEFVDREVTVLEEYVPAPIQGFMIISEAEEDKTAELIYNENYQVLVVMYDLDKTNKAYMKEVNELYTECRKRGVDFAAVTGSPSSEISLFKAETSSDFDIHFADGTNLKTVVRSNPGVVLLKNGFVIDKWHYKDIPNLEELTVKGPSNAFFPVK